MSEMDRILSIPVADVDGAQAAAEYTRRFRVPGGEWSLHPSQGEALYWIERLGGALLPMGVGAGKTLLAYLIPRVLDVDPERVLVLVPAKTRKQFERSYYEYAEQFDVDPLTICSYAELSRADEVADLVPEPTLVVCDEAHMLRNLESKRTRNFRRFMRHFPETSMVAMSATLTTNSIFDYAHLADWTLGEGSPLPRSYSRLSAWARILDSPAGGHAIVGPEASDWGQISELMQDPRFRPPGNLGAVECARRAFEARFSSCPGIVRTLEPSCDQPIHWTFWDGPAPKTIEQIRKQVDADACLPNGIEIEDQLRLTAKLKQIAMGFYYYWDWPGGEIDVEWMRARNEYSQAVRRVVKVNKLGLDSKGDVERLIAGGSFYNAELEAAYIEWERQLTRMAEPPETAVEWIDDSVLRAALDDARAALDDGHNPIIWYTHCAEVDRLEELVSNEGLFEVLRSGDELEGDRPGLIASQWAHGTGLHLARFDWMLVLVSSASGGHWEQLVGRIHRQGQERPCHVRVYRHTKELKSAFRSATVDGKYLKETQRIPAKILTARANED